MESRDEGFSYSIWCTKDFGWVVKMSAEMSVERWNETDSNALSAK